MLSPAQMNRLRWQCTHRSMRELDVVLESFLEREFSTLSEEEQGAFVDLVELLDTELWPLISGRTPSKNPTQAALIARLHHPKIGK